MLTEFFDKHGVEWSKTDKHSRHSWTQARPCPRCSNDRFHLGIKDDFSRSSCYTCGSFHVPKLLKDLTDAPWSEIYKLLGSRAYLPKEADTASKGVYTPPTLLQPLEAVPAVAAYLKQRSFDLEYLETVWGVRATGPFSNYPFRVFMPIYLNRKAVSWTARAACGQEPRYRNAGPGEKSIDEKTLLFGAQFVKDTCIICEGPTDVFRVGKGCVATLGVSYTMAQVDRLASIWRRIICFDNSENAQRRANKLAAELSVFPGETIVVNLDAEDPGSASEQEVRQLRRFAFGEK
jgi:hypothetical protein